MSDSDEERGLLPAGDAAVNYQAADAGPRPADNESDHCSTNSAEAFFDTYEDAPWARSKQKCRPRTIVVLVLCLIVLVGIILALTVFADPLRKYSITFHNVLKFGSIPVVSVIFTYCHIWLALYLTFYPLEFIGCCKVIGWQGIVPKKAAKMAAKSVDLMTMHLFNVKETFSKINPDRVADLLRPTMAPLLKEICDVIGVRCFPTIWGMMSDNMKSLVAGEAQADVAVVVRHVMTDIRENIELVFDLKEMAVSTLVNDKELLNHMFLTCGHEELEFIKAMGGYLGFIFGMAQMVLWIYYEWWWVLPVTGLVVGLLTNWLALKAIFRPIDPILCCGGRCRVQGLFLKRQQEVAADYGHLVATHILPARKIIQGMVSGPLATNLVSMVEQHTVRALDANIGRKKMLLVASVGGEKFKEVQGEVCKLVTAKMSTALLLAEDYIDKSLDLENTLRERLRYVPPAVFETLLHSVFQEDEWMLILMGGVLGVIVGTIQAFGLQ